MIIEYNQFWLFLQKSPVVSTKEFTLERKKWSQEWHASFLATVTERGRTLSRNRPAIADSLQDAVL